MPRQNRRRTTKRVPRCHFVSSTHWDREWYEPFQHYRFRLVRVIDLLIDLMERGERFRYFQFDGQTILIEDYVEIRPENRARLEALIRAGRIQVGPWYVMPDEFLPCGEALVRNLLRGHFIARQYGGAMSVGFVNDMFGHNSQFPQILRGFGIADAVIWRGTNVSSHPGLFNWRAADGSEVLAFAFGREGYGLYFWDARRPCTNAIGEMDVAATLNITEGLIVEEAHRVPGDVLLMFDGMDHAVPEPRTADLIAAANARGHDFVHSTLAEFFADVRRQRLSLRTYAGELRDPPETRSFQLLSGVFSSRIALKQANAACENLLLQWAEPASVFAWLLGGDYPARYLDVAWKHLLLNHPHDSICGCSIDQVHRDMVYRFDQCRLVADRVTHMSLRAIADETAIPALADDEQAVTIFNPTLRPLSEVVDVPLYFPQDTPHRYRNWFGDERVIGLRLYDAGGNERDFQRLEETPRVTVNTYDDRFGYEGAVLTRVRVALPLEIPALGWTTLVCKPCAERTGGGGSQLVDDHTMQNEHLRVTANPNGTIDVTNRDTGDTFAGGLLFEEQADVGDGWYHGPPANDELFTSHGSAADIAVVHDGFALTTLRVRVVMNVPQRWEHDRAEMRRSADLAPLEITSWLTLRAGARHIEVRTEVNNTIEDHRIRVLFPTRLHATTYFADTPFDIVERAIALRPDRHKLHEPEIETKPQHSITAVNDGRRGLAILSVGQPESAVRDIPDRPIALTLLRGFKRTVGTPGEPDAQSLGRATHHYWICPHAGPLPAGELFHQANRLAGELRYVHTSPQRRKWLTDTARLPSTGGWVTASNGPLVLTALKRSEDGEAIILRAFNPTNARIEQTVTFPAQIAAAHYADLQEQRTQPAATRGQSLTIAANAKQIVTLRITLVTRTNSRNA